MAWPGLKVPDSGRTEAAQIGREPVASAGGLAARRWAAVWLLMATGLFSIPHASATCGWRQPNGDVTSIADETILLNSIGLKLVASKRWYEDGRFAVGSLMGTDQTHFSLVTGCAQLREIAGGRLEVVYVPPADAVPHGQGYRLRPYAIGVAVDIEFATGTPHPHGMSLAQSITSVGAGGVLGANGFAAPIPLRITLVKTAAFTGVGQQSLVQMPGSLGSLRYYKVGNPAVVAASYNVLRLPPSYGSGAQAYVGRALAPHCVLTRLGDGPLEQGTQVIRLASVSRNDFHGPGGLDRSADTRQVGITCEGSDHLRPVLSLDTPYPFNNGIDGVGLPERESDIGVQVLFNDQPLRLGTPSRALDWSPQPLRSELADGNGGFVSAQGLFCQPPCPADMSGPGWINGGASQGDNQGHDARLTFRYYQTTGTPPLPRTFAVPFTLSLDVQ